MKQLPAFGWWQLNHSAAETLAGIGPPHACFTLAVKLFAG